MLEPIVDRKRNGNTTRAGSCARRFINGPLQACESSPEFQKFGLVMDRELMLRLVYILHRQLGTPKVAGVERQPTVPKRATIMTEG